MLEAVIFDFDGVILDSEPLHYEACCMALKTIGISLSYTDYMTDYLGLSDKEMFPQLLMSKGHYLSPKEVNQLLDKKIESYAYLINSRNKLPFIPGVEQYLLNLRKAAIKIAICTGSTKTELLPVLERFKSGNLTHYFDVIVTSEEIQYGKPSPEGYLLTISRLGVLPKYCQAFEDSPYGIEAAKKAGLKVTALATTHRQQELKNADQVIANFEELLVEKSLSETEIV